MTPSASRDRPTSPEVLHQAARALVRAGPEGGVLVVIGAGLSAPSGLPTFRRGGEFTPLWKSGKELHFDDWVSDPARIWAFLGGRIQAPGTDRARPVAHLPLARVLTRLRSGGARVTVITQNLDLLLEDALDELGFVEGHPHRPEVHHVHGRLGWRCSGCAASGRLEDGEPPAQCPGCGAAQERWEGSAHHPGVRPDVVLFGEDLQGFTPLWDTVPDHHCALVVGSSLQVTPVGSVPNRLLHYGPGDSHVVVCDEVLPERLLWTPRERCSWLRGDVTASLEALEQACDRELQGAPATP